MAAGQNISDYSPGSAKGSQGVSLKELVILCVIIAIILVLMYTTVLLLFKTIRERRNSLLSTDSTEGKDSGKTVETSKRRQTFKENINSIYIKWTPDYTED